MKLSMRGKRCPNEPFHEATMPFLFYLPLIIWTGLFGLAHQPKPVPVKIKPRR
jgi:hypothetical protein